MERFSRTATRAVAWLIHVGHARWIVRNRDKASRRMKLNAAKKYAREMFKGDSLWPSNR